MNTTKLIIQIYIKYIIIYSKGNGDIIILT